MNIGGPVKKPQAVQPLSASEESSAPMPETPTPEAVQTLPEPQADTEKADLPMNEEEFMALPPKQAFQAYMELKTGVDKRVQDALDALTAKHETDIATIKASINEALYGAN